MAMSEHIALDDQLMGGISDHAVSTYPEECCGFLYGFYQDDNLEVKIARPVENMKTKSRTNRYLISPGQYLEAEKYADEAEMELVGVYHSHPDHPAVPSDFDLEMALPGFIYLIVGVKKGTISDSRWWRLSTDRRQFLEISISK